MNRALRISALTAPVCGVAIFCALGATVTGGMMIGWLGTLFAALALWNIRTLLLRGGSYWGTMFAAMFSGILAAVLAIGLLVFLATGVMHLAQFDLKSPFGGGGGAAPQAPSSALPGYVIFAPLALMWLGFAIPAFHAALFTHRAIRIAERAETAQANSRDSGRER